MHTVFKHNLCIADPFSPNKVELRLVKLIVLRVLLEYSIAPAVWSFQKLLADVGLFVYQMEWSSGVVFQMIGVCYKLLRGHKNSPYDTYSYRVGPYLNWGDIGHCSGMPDFTCGTGMASHYYR